MPSFMLLSTLNVALHRIVDRCPEARAITADLLGLFFDEAPSEPITYDDTDEGQDSMTSEGPDELDSEDDADEGHDSMTPEAPDELDSEDDADVGQENMDLEAPDTPGHLVNYAYPYFERKRRLSEQGDRFEICGYCNVEYKVKENTRRNPLTCPIAGHSGACLPYTIPCCNTSISPPPNVCIPIIYMLTQIAGSLRLIYKAADWIDYNAELLGPINSLK
jgi:hypothetical protein